MPYDGGWILFALITYTEPLLLRSSSPILFVEWRSNYTIRSADLCFPQHPIPWRTRWASSHGELSKPTAARRPPDCRQPPQYSCGPLL